MTAAVETTANTQDATAVIQIPLGIALDRWGPRWVVSGFMSLAVVGSLLFAVAPSFWMLGLLAGVVGAIAGAFRGLWAGSYALDVLRLEQMDGGNLLLLMGIGSMLGSSSAGWLADRLGERRVGISLAVLCASCQIVLAAGPSAMLGGLFYLLFGFSTGVIVVAVAQARSLFPGTMIGQVLTLMNLFAFAGTFALQWAMGRKEPLPVGGQPAKEREDSDAYCYHGYPGRAPSGDRVAQWGSGQAGQAVRHPRAAELCGLRRAQAIR